MLIYHKKDNQLFVTQVMHSFNGTEYQTFKKTPSTLPKNLQSKLERLDNTTVFITGDTSGYKDRYSGYRKLRHCLNDNLVMKLVEGEKQHERR